MEGRSFKTPILPIKQAKHSKKERKKSSGSWCFPSHWGGLRKRFQRTKAGQDEAALEHSGQRPVDPRRLLEDPLKDGVGHLQSLVSHQDNVVGVQIFVQPLLNLETPQRTPPAPGSAEHSPRRAGRRERGPYFVVEEADPQDVLHAGRSVGHAQVPQRVSHQDDVGVLLQLFEVLGVPQGSVVFVVHVDQLAFEAPDDALRLREKIRSEPEPEPEPAAEKTRSRCRQSP